MPPVRHQYVHGGFEGTDTRFSSFAIGAGVRDAERIWTPVQAQRLLDLTRAHGGILYVAEFFNEPNLALMGGAPQGYTAEDYGRDFQLFTDRALRSG